MRNEEMEGPATSPIIYRPPRNSFVMQKIFVDFVVIIILVIPIVVLFFVGVPFKRGFNCDDESLRYPYRENTISSVVLYIYSVSIPLLVIAINEFAILRRNFHHFDTHSDPEDYFWKLYSWQMYLNIVPFLFAIATSQLITDIAKYSVGRLRPHFIDLCRPSLPDGQILYRNSPCNLHPYTYITDFQCTNEAVYASWGIHYPSLRDTNVDPSRERPILDRDDYRIFRDVRLSFFSGHSSCAAVCMTYLVMYTQFRIKWTAMILLKALFQSALILLALFTGFTRISDYKHHWSDVAAGLGVGATVAIICALKVSDMAKPRSNPQRHQNAVIVTSASTTQFNRESGV